MNGLEVRTGFGFFQERAFLINLSLSSFAVVIYRKCDMFDSVIHNALHANAEVCDLLSFPIIFFDGNWTVLYTANSETNFYLLSDSPYLNDFLEMIMAAAL